MTRVDVLPLILFLALGACTRTADDSAGSRSGNGRYASVGIYSPGTEWTKLADDQEISNPKAAKPIDDQAIIVVQDTVTGEVRSCGDLTGYCIRLNPWKTGLTPSRTSPVLVTEHKQPDSGAGPQPAEPAAKALK